MKKSVLVIGIGRFGRGVIESLYKKGHDIFAIDINEEALDDIRDMIVTGAIFDVAEDDDELIRLVEDKNFDEAVIAMGEDFEATLIATHVIKDAGIHVSVKASNERRGNVLKKLGADRVVFPERDMGRRLAELISNEAIIDILELPQGFVVEQMEIGPKLAGKSLVEIDISNRFGLWILLIYQKNEPIIPTAATILNKDDILIIFGPKSKMNKFENENII